MYNVQIKDATPEDAPFIARCVLSAVRVNDFGEVPPFSGELAGCCRRTDTLYSFQNARMAFVDGVRAGCTKAALIVDISREALKGYYSSFGFSSPDEIAFMGHRYYRMTVVY